MLPYIPIGPVVIPAFPFLVLIGLWAGMGLAAKEAARFGIDGDHVYNIGLYGSIAGLLGGRGWYVITHWAAYKDTLIQAAALTANAIDPLGFTLVALITALAYALRHQLPLLQLADAIAPGALLTLVIGGIGAFLGSQALGTPTDLPWGVTLYGETRHPAHLYLVATSLLILGLIWQVKRNPRWPAFTALWTIVLYAASRLLLDPTFASPSVIGPGFRTVQVIALVMMVVALLFLMRLDWQNWRTNTYTSQTE